MSELIFVIPPKADRVDRSLTTWFALLMPETSTTIVRVRTLVSRSAAAGSSVSRRMQATGVT